AYAVGYRSNFRHILVLGLSTAIAHTVTILVLALILGTTVSSIESENAHQWIEVGSGERKKAGSSELLVQPTKTMVKWHFKAFRRFWRQTSKYSHQLDYRDHHKPCLSSLNKAAKSRSIFVSFFINLHQKFGRPTLFCSPKSPAPIIFFSEFLAMV
ncbi:MAG: hypothetical protein LH472_09655, partial [Pyrinomonadaceae bacterium]|nr:hypothetical protein [Pyrinomonadaceae bacterium]